MGIPNVPMDTDLIGSCLFLEDNLIEADVAIVFGMNDWQRPAERAIELYRSGKARFLLFTGGFNSNLGECEAVAMSDFARKAGLPDRAILMESRAAHTEENMLFSKEILETHPELRELRSAILVTIHYHLRRAILAARRHLPAPVELGWTTYPSRHYSASDWYKSARGRSNATSEVAKIGKYYAVSLTDLAGQRP